MSIEKGLVLKDSQTTAVSLYTLSGSEDSKSDMSMLMENTPLNINNLLAKHGQVNITVDHTYIHEVKELTRASQQISCGNTKGKIDRLHLIFVVLSIIEVSHSTDNYTVKNIMGKYQFTSKSVEYGKS